MSTTKRYNDLTRETRSTRGPIAAREERTLLTVTLNRPKKKNATSAEILCGLSDAWRQLDEDDELRVATLTGVGDVFCAGIDLSLIPRLAAGKADNEYEERLMKEGSIALDAFLKTYRPTKPVIAAVEGYALAGGTKILQGTDIRVAAESARFGITEVQRSLFPIAGSSVWLPRQIPYTVAVEILLTGDAISAGRAYELGLVGHVVPDGHALTRAREIAARIEENGPLAVKAILASIRQTEGPARGAGFRDRGPHRDRRVRIERRHRRAPYHRREAKARLAGEVATHATRPSPTTACTAPRGAAGPGVPPSTSSPVQAAPFPSEKWG